ncbi:DUF5666 domain-containing protein [Terrarubrum flagellatum]|uniref:DUF5666 domain-containing protein n=1 Tax=Terrirubrum flagellatum TaxID=2895980 RepID=UPI0031452C3F
MTSRWLAAILLFLCVAPASAFAQSTPMRVRGVIEKLDGANLTVNSRDSGMITIRLADNWSVGGLKPAKLEDIKAGDFVGVAAMPQSDGTMRAMEVLVFPPGAKGGEGHYPWDLAPESTMTNASVTETVQGVSGRTLKLTYQGGEKSIVVPPDAPVVTFAPADKADVKPGMSVFIGAQKQSDGSLTAMRVTVGNNGVAPPM